MADQGEKTEKPTGRRIAEAWAKGQFPKTMEIQTVFVLLSGLLVLSLMSHRIVRVLSTAIVETLGQIGRLTVTPSSIGAYLLTFLQWLGACAIPVMAAASVAAIIAGALQSRFHLSLDRLEWRWTRLNPAMNIQQLFQPIPSLMRTLVGGMKFLVILGLTVLVIKRLLEHPIFYSATSFGEVVLFMTESVRSVATRVLVGLAIIAAADYGYQYWKHQKDLMMTKEEVKEEAKSAEGNPQVKGEIRKRRMAILRQNWIREIPRADVVVTNPTHLAVALRYDRKTMRAPRIVAKGARLNALRIREIAQQFQVPIVENKPVAQLLFKHCKIGQEVPPQVYSAVAEILAYVYRVNRFRYYLEGQKATA
ncbi:MAG: EscU/YscU/HrcU family type III secretion system export apparatus switch protein [Verrucomicrobia bacterium]|nr:EscU/YscU/HrcU family type III secretion system export apparatus switch protein [Verrucomicrobiota bacterium]